jgi:hypothetical protein
MGIYCRLSAALKVFFCAFALGIVTGIYLSSPVESPAVPAAVLTAHGTPGPEMTAGSVKEVKMSWRAT